jgi:hypothetical protein
MLEYFARDKVGLGTGIGPEGECRKCRNDTCGDGSGGVSSSSGEASDAPAVNTLNGNIFEVPPMEFCS